MGRIELLMQFVEQSPGDPFPRYGLALELKNAGRLEEAERVFDELIRRFPDYIPAYLHAGGVLAAQGRREDARAIYRAGIQACGARRPPDGHAESELRAALAALDGGDDDEEAQP